MTRPLEKSPRRKRDSNPGSSALEVDALTTRPSRLCRHTGKAGFDPRSAVLEALPPGRRGCASRGTSADIQILIEANRKPHDDVTYIDGLVNRDQFGRGFQNSFFLFFRGNSFWCAVVTARARAGTHAHSYTRARTHTHTHTHAHTHTHTHTHMLTMYTPTPATHTHTLLHTHTHDTHTRTHTQLIGRTREEGGGGEGREEWRVKV